MIYSRHYSQHTDHGTQPRRFWSRYSMTLYWLRNKAWSWSLFFFFDFSAAFDTVDHYHRRLRKQVWYFNVILDMVPQLPFRPLIFCTQGSTLGPLFCVTYAPEFQNVAERHGIGFHGYADDIQLSKSVRVEEAGLAKQVMIDCVLDIQRWSSSHRLKLNPCKSEVVWLGTRQQLARLSHDDKVLELPDGALQPSTIVKNLGVHLDDTDNGR